VHYGPAFEDISTTLKRLVEQTRTSERTPIMSVLLEGSAFTGKTAVAANVAVESQFPFVRKISADEMVSLAHSACWSDGTRMMHVEPCALLARPTVLNWCMLSFAE
jgi:AAA+ superfamily predicted ATPase